MLRSVKNIGEGLENPIGQCYTKSPVELRLDRMFGFVEQALVETNNRFRKKPKKNFKKKTCKTKTDMLIYKSCCCERNKRAGHTSKINN